MQYQGSQGYHRAICKLCDHPRLSVHSLLGLQRRLTGVGVAFGAAYLIGAFPASGYGKAPISEMDPVKLTPSLVGSASQEARFVTGACARSHCILVDDQGEVWGCGNNVVGQIGPVST